MKRVLYGATALAALAAATPAAFATDGAYGRIDLGYTFEGEVETNDAIIDDRDLDEEIMGSAGVGYAFSNGFRVEGELSFRENDFDSDVAGVGGDIGANAIMANLFYDFNKDGGIQPYVGLGAGWADVDGSATDGVIDYEVGDQVWAYQGMLGVAFGLTEQLDLDIGYRYFKAPDVGASGGLLTELDYTTQTATVGLRYQFASPAPPPPPPPPPMMPPPPPPPVQTCPTADFVVYFEWDRADLNQAALQTIDAAIAQARNCNLNAVSVIGHTDTSGSAAYNVGLSERRASVVRDAIVARGISDASVTTSAKGETELARETPDGTREPLNRRAAVTISFR
jgi:OOP family OmpA-OmpF porin